LKEGRGYCHQKPSFSGTVRAVFDRLSKAWIMVSHKKLVNVYLPEELYQALIAYQDQLGFEEVSDAVVPILAQFFHKGGEIKRYATVEQLEALEGKLTHMSKQVAQLTQVIASAAPTEATRTVPKVGSEYTRPTLTAHQRSVAFVSTNIEDEEDEPDEILYDFLEPGRPPSP